MELHKEYHLLSTGKELKFSVDMNHDTYLRERGYELSCTPTEREGVWESFCSSDVGHYEIVLPANRKSKKRTAEAIAITKSRVLPIMTRYEQKYNPGHISWERVNYSGTPFDVSGITDPDNWLWSITTNLHIYYPTIQIIGKIKSVK